MFSKLLSETNYYPINVLPWGKTLGIDRCHQNNQFIYLFLVPLFSFLSSFSNFISWHLSDIEQLVLYVGGRKI